MIFVGGWLISGFLGWAIMMAYRIQTEEEDYVIPLKSYVKGFLLALLLGPICFLFLSYLLFRRKDDKADQQ